ncbi:MAG: hypothetical protein EBQ96_03935 [Proteobacteria bacterium]|nr:hypothetical protein [Pseudomonadota bacterium]
MTQENDLSASMLKAGIELLPFAPVLGAHEGADAELNAGVLQDMLRELEKQPLGSLIQMQRRALGPVWEGLADIIGSPDWNAEKLGGTFAVNALNTRLAMMPLPAIVAYKVTVDPKTKETELGPTDSDYLRAALNPILKPFDIHLGQVGANFGIPAGRYTKMSMKGAAYTGFGFMNFVRKRTVNEVERSELITLPYLELPPSIISAAREQKLDGMLQECQVLFGLTINHDWYHSDTGRTLSIFQEQEIFSTSDTPVGLFDDERKGPSDTDTVTNSLMYENEGLAFADPALDSYEAFGLHAQAEVFQRQYEKNEGFRDFVHARLDSYFEKLGQLHAKPDSEGEVSSEVSQNMQFYMATFMVHHLMRVVPNNHPLIEYASACIDAHLKLEDKYLREQTARRVLSRGRETTKKISSMTGFNILSSYRAPWREKMIQNDLAQLAKGRGSDGDEPFYPETKPFELPNALRIAFAPIAALAGIYIGGAKKFISDGRQASHDMRGTFLMWRMKKMDMKPSDHIVIASIEQSLDNHGLIHTEANKRHRAKLPAVLKRLHDGLMSDSVTIALRQAEQKERPHLFPKW